MPRIQGVTETLPFTIHHFLRSAFWEADIAQSKIISVAILVGEAMSAPVKLFMRRTGNAKI